MRRTYLLGVTCLLSIFLLPWSSAANTVINIGTGNSVNTGKIVINGVENGNCREGSGRLSSENRSVESFRGVDISGVVNADIIVGEPFSVAVEADDNILDMIATEVKNDVLRVYSQGSFCTENEVAVTIRLPLMHSLSVSGSSDVKMALSEKTDSLVLRLADSSTLSVSGEAKNSNIVISGSSELLGSEFSTAMLTIKASDSAEATLEVTEKLSGEARDASEVTFTGAPRLDVQAYDVGEFISAQ